MSVQATSAPEPVQMPKAGAWNLGKKSQPIWGATSRRSGGGRSARDCPFTASSTADSVRSTPTQRNWMLGGTNGRPQAQPMLQMARPVSEVLRSGVRARAAAALAALALTVSRWPANGLCASVEHTTGECQRGHPSLAVLPLQNFSGNPEQDYLSDGMTEALIARLSTIHALRVISRTSAMQFKGTRKSVPTIGKELNVDAVIEGSVLRSGDKIRVTVQLIRADTGRAPVVRYI